VSQSFAKIETGVTNNSFETFEQRNDNLYENNP